MATTETTREQREAVIVALVGEHDPKLRYPAWQRWIDTGDEEPRDPTNKYDGPPPRAVRLASLLASHAAAAAERARSEERERLCSIIASSDDVVRGDRLWLLTRRMRGETVLGRSMDPRPPRAGEGGS